MSLATGKKLGSVRDSKLTMILKESLGGNAKTTLLVAANRWKNNVDESVNTLDFAKRAKQIKNKCKSNIQINPKELQYFVEYMKEEILKLRGQLKAKGIDYHKISDKKVKTIIKDEEFVMEDGSTPVEEEKASPNKSVAGKRNSIIGLSEQDIIIKYCEMRAKYDNLLQSAGSAIYSLNKSVEQSSDQVQNASYEINSLKVETDEKLQQIVNQKNQEITSLNEKIEALKKQHEKSEEELNAKHTQLLKAKLKIEDELDSSKKDYESLQSMFEMTSNDVQVFQQELEEEKKKLEEKEEEIKNIKLEIEAKSESLKDVQSKLSDSENKNKETLEKLEEMSNKFLLEAENFKNITKQYEDLENRFNSQTKAFSEEKEKFHESLLQSEKKYTEVNNKLCELELKYENEVKSSTDKDAFNQTQIQNLKQENENLNRLIKENTSGQEILAEKEKILEQTKFYLEKRIEEVEDECGNLKQQLIETVTKSNNEKGALSLEIENLNFNLKVKNEEIQTRDVEFETFKKNQENRFNVEVLKSEQLLSRLDNSEKKISELENLNNDLTSNDKKLTFENNLLNKKIDEKQNLLEMQKSLITKYEEDIQKAHKDNKEIKDGIKENSNRLRELEAEVKKYENDKKLLESEVEFKNKKVQDAEQKLKEQKAENKVMQETIRNLQKKIDELELENTRQKRVANIPVRKDEAPKEKMNVFSAFGVTLKKTTNAYTEKLREEEREGQLRTKLIFKDNEEELKKLHACIDNSSPKTVSSRCINI
jgi:chromosome segregation ATPase